MKYRLTEKTGQCGFEGYDPNSRSMKVCGCESNIMAGKNYVCNGHLNFALQSDRKPQVYSWNNKEITIKMFKALVSDYVPKKEVKEDVQWI